MALKFIVAALVFVALLLGAQTYRLSVSQSKAQAAAQAAEDRAFTEKHDYYRKWQGACSALAPLAKERADFATVATVCP